jgi:hypothetical protein
VVGKVEISGIEHRRPSEQPAQDRRLEVVDHDFLGHPPEEVKGVLMAGQEVLQALTDGELDIEHATVAEHHRKEAQAPAGVADGNRSVGAPVDLGALPGGEGERQVGGALGWPDGTHVVLDDTVAAGIALLADTHKDLHGAKRMGFEQPGDLGFEGVQLA